MAFDSFTWTWMGIGGAALLLAILVGFRDRARGWQMLSRVQQDSTRYQMYLDEVLALQHRQFNFLERQEKLLQRAERLLDRLEVQVKAPAPSVPAPGHPSDTSITTSRPNPRPPE